jgi:hypothetical protein
MYLITNPVGIDVPIQRLQKLLDAELYTAAKRHIYGRAFHNVRGDGVVPEVYKGGGEYKEVLFNDRQDLTVFFDIEGDVQFLPNGNASIAVGIVVQCNLKRLHPDKGRHAGEIVERDVLALIERSSPFHINSVVKGYPAVEMFALTDRVKFDMQPHYVFRIKTDVTYLYNDC